MGGGHNGSCAKATGHVCKCGGCGGSQHGWQGWLAVAGALPADREDARKEYEGRLQWDQGRLKDSQKTRAAVTDLARLDIADWLATRTPDEAPDRDPKERTRQPDQKNDVLISPVDQIDAFAQAMTKGVWQEIAAEIDREAPGARDIRRELASHVWCDLFLGLARVTEVGQGVLNRIPDAAADLVKQTILGSTMHGGRSLITEAVVDIVVRRVWTAFRTAAFNGVPLLNILAGEDALRAMRILAVFICPAPEKHREVREYALKPLGNDVRDILTEQTKTRLAELFAEWRAAPA
jgi:hypothetical protein